MSFRQLRVSLAGALLLALLWFVPSPLRSQSVPSQILVVVNSAAPNPFGAYLPEILRAEGIKNFTTAQLASVDAPTLSLAELVILTETPLSAAQATLFNNYVAAGGRLIAMRPDAQIAATLGVSSVATSTTNGYMAIQQSDPTGAGLTSLTLPVKGTTAHYAPFGGATVLATLYSDRSTPTAYPAVVRYHTTATWAFDLARAVAYARQGDPAAANTNPDLPVFQAYDLFYTGFDAQRIRVPYADVEMRLFSRVIRDLLADEVPLPQLWYYPSARRAMMIVGADAHFADVAPYTELMNTAETFGARVTLFLSRWLSYPTAAEVNDWRARGHEISMHPNGFEDGLSLSQGFQRVFSYFGQMGWGAPGPTVRTHQLEWLGWVEAANIAASFGARLDLSQYSFGPAVLQPDGTQGMGYITGSGRPMRFVREDGTLLPVYGLSTTFIDHQLFGIWVYADNLTAPQALARTTQVINESLAEYHTVMPTQFHVDYYTWGQVRPWADGTMQYAQANNVPMWTGERWLRYTEARDATTLTNVSWTASTRQLQFTATVPSGAEAQTVMVPASYAGGPLISVLVNGSPETVTTQTINGRSYGMASVAATAGGAPVVATYSTASALSVNDVSVVEGTGGTNAATFTVTLEPAASTAVTVAFATANGTAIAPGDYTAGSGTLSFAAGQTTQTVAIPIITDALDEPLETFSVQLSNPVGATIMDSAGYATILNDDAVIPTVSVSDVSITEGNAGSTAATFTATLSAPATGTVTVSWATANGTATSGSDYTAASGTLTFLPGTTAQPGVVTVLGDTTVEANETFSVTLSAPVNATLGDATGVGTIVNDDTGSSSNFTHTTFADFAPGIRSGTIVPHAADGEVRLAGTFSEEYAAPTLGSQWTAGAWSGGAITPNIVGGVLSLGGVTGGSYVRSTNPLPVTTIEARTQFSAAAFEHVGWASLDFATSQYAIFSTGPGTTTLFARTNTSSGEQTTDLGPIPASMRNFRIDRVAQGVGVDQFHYFIDGALVATHTVSNMPASLHVYQSVASVAPPLTVDSLWVYPTHASAGSFEAPVFDAGTAVTWAQATWTAQTPAGTTLGVRTRTSTDGTNFSPWSALLTTSGQGITSPVGRYLQYGLDLTTTNSGISPTLESLTITSTGATPQLSITDVSVTEGNSGSASATFTVNLSLASSQSVSVNYATADVTAAAGSDYTGGSGTLTFAAGTMSQALTVSILGDTTLEANETFAVNLSNPVNATIADAQGIGTIVNDDSPSISIGDVSITEGNTGATNATFTLSLSAAAAQVVSVNWGTANVTATAGSDYTAGSGTATFAIGTTTQAVSVPVFGDTTVEPNETFELNLSGAVNATVADAQGIGTIVNDDVPGISIDDVSVAEGNSGTTTATVTVSLSGATTQAVSVNWATANGTATAGSDYSAGSGTATFAIGITTQSFTVSVSGDTTVEATETFVVNLSGAVNATIADAQGTVTIVNDDGVPAIAINDVSATEGNAGTTNATFTISLSTAGAQAISVAWSTANGTAAAGTDYSTASGTANFPIGTTTQTVIVPVLGDTLDEINETFVINLSSPVNATIGDAQGVGTILDDDAAPTLAINDVTVSETNAPGTATFTVSLSAASGQVVTVNYATVNGTAVAPADFTAASSLLTISAGSTSGTIPVTITGDTVNEPTETFSITLSTPTNATLADATGVVTILDDDVVAPPSSASSLQFNGTNARARFTTLPAMSAFTVEAWVKRTSDTGRYETLLADASANFSQESIGIYIDGGNQDCGSSPGDQFGWAYTKVGGGWFFQCSGVTANLNAWHHIAVGRDASGTARLFIDGVLRATATNVAAPTTSTGALNLGDAGDATDEYFPGRLDEVRISNVARYTATFTPQTQDFVTDANTVALYHLAEGTGQALADSSGNGRNGFLGTTSATEAADPVWSTDTPYTGAPQPALSIGDVSTSEGNSGSSTATFTVNLSVASVQVVSVNYATADVTATAGSDYTGGSGTVTFPAGTISQAVTVSILGDTTLEANETFTVNLNGAVNATIADAQGIGTIVNDDVPGIAIADVSVTEGNTGTTNATFTVSLSGVSTQVVSVNYATADVTATAGSDYTAGSGAVTFAVGTTTQAVTVPILGDTTPELNETFVVNLSGAVNATIADAQGVATIVNDDVPSIAIADVSVTEGNTGTTAASFTVSLSGASTQVISVNWGTANGTATAGSDYTAGSGTVTFAVGTTTQAVTVPVIGDTTLEANETFVVNLSGAVNGTIADAQGVGTIVNDDVPSIAIADVSVTEGNTGTTNASFSVSLSGASTQVVSVNWATANGTATAGSDYTAGSGTVTFAVGTTTQAVNVPVLGDTTLEANETFVVNLSGPVNGTIADAQGVGTIVNDDGVPVISINDVSATEGNAGTTNATFTISLSTAGAQAISVAWSTANGTAAAGTDYSTASGTANFPIGTTTQTVLVPVPGDTLDEPNETFVVNLSSPVNATIGDAQGVGTILDDDAAPTLAINDVTVSETNAPGTATFTVSLSAASGQVVTVNYATVNGTAVAPADFTAASSLLTISAGSTSGTIPVTITGDTVNEPTETFSITLSTPTNATLADATGAGTILDDDVVAPPSSASSLQFNGTNTRARFTTLPAMSAFTVEGWVKRTSDTGRYETLLADASANFSQESIGIYIDGGNQDCGSSPGDQFGWAYTKVGGGWFFQCSGVTANLNAWHHIAVGRDASGTARLFIDGVLRATATNTAAPTSSTGALNLGDAGDATDEYFPGRIDEVRISNVVRYTATFTPQTQDFATDANTVALYHLAEGTGQTVADSSGNGRNGFLGTSSATETVDPVWSTDAPYGGP